VIYRPDAGTGSLKEQRQVLDEVKCIDSLPNVPFLETWSVLILRYQVDSGGMQRREWQGLLSVRTEEVGGYFRG